MKTMKFLRNILVMTVAMLSLASCSSDDNDMFEPSNLSGTWERVWDEGVMDAGNELYTFIPESSTNGKIEISFYVWPSGDATLYRNYVVNNSGHLIISLVEPQSDTQGRVEYDIRILNNNEMIWLKTNSNEEIIRFKKVSEF